MASKPSSSSEACSSVLRVLDPLGPPRAQDAAGDGALDRHALAVDGAVQLTGPGGDHELVVLGQHDHERARAHERPRPLDDQLEDAAQVGLAAERLRDRDGRVQAAIRPLEVVAALLDRPVEPGVVDRDRRPVGEDHGGLLVGVGERLAVLLLGQVEVAPDLVADHHRHAEERLHLRVRGGEAVGLRMVADVLEPQRARLLDQQPEDPPAAREIADRAVRLGSIPAVMKRVELLPAVVEHADGRVARAGDLAGDVEQLLQHGLHVELGDQAATRIDQAPEAELIKGRR